MNDIAYSYDAVNFHKSFVPQEIYITKILELAEQGYSGSKENISLITGIPTGKTSGKVVPHILYAQYMGLITNKTENGKYVLDLTDLGKTVFKEDKHIFENVTKMICHYNICDKKHGALQWSYLYYNIEPMLNESLNFDNIKKGCSEFYQQKSEIDVIRKAYTGDGFWGRLNILNFNDGFSIRSSYYNEMYKYVYAYSLLNSWEEYFPNSQEISVEEISDILKWNRKFGFDSDEMQFTLDELNSEGIIKINKQLFQYTVIRTTESKELLSHLYDLLG